MQDRKSSRKKGGGIQASRDAGAVPADSGESMQQVSRRLRWKTAQDCPLIGFRKPDDRKAEDAGKRGWESSEPAEADDPEDAKEIP